MSRGELLRRAAAVGLVAVFPLAAGGELLPGHLCPHHDAAFAGGGHAAGEAAHGSGTPPSVHARPGDAGGGGSDRGSPDEPTHPCTCIGSCHAGAAVALLAGGPLLQATATVRPVAAPRESADPGLPPIPYLLPFANGPPIA